jgi:hypothetical protein
MLCICLIVYIYMKNFISDYVHGNEQQSESRSNAWNANMRKNLMYIEYRHKRLLRSNSEGKTAYFEL